MSHPCSQCGACCAQFNVQFYWRETDPVEGYGTPLKLTEDIDPLRKQMRSIGPKHLPRCVALQGKLGKKVECSIYERRPTPCRQFAASFENGERNSRCDAAREVYGLRPLRPEDFARFFRERAAVADPGLGT